MYQKKVYNFEEDITMKGLLVEFRFKFNLTFKNHKSLTKHACGRKEPK